MINDNIIELVKKYNESKIGDDFYIHNLHSLCGAIKSVSNTLINGIYLIEGKSDEVICEDIRKKTFQIEAIVDAIENMINADDYAIIDDLILELQKQIKSCKQP